MPRPEPTRVVSLLVLAYAWGGAWGCQGPDPRAARPAPAQRPSAVAKAPTPTPATIPASTAPARAERKPLRVLVLGDSLSDEKVGGGGFVRSLREHCPGVAFDNRAKGGFMVNQIRKRLESEVLPEGVTYSHAIVFGGVNDLYSDQTANRTLPRIESDLARIYTALKARQVEVIAITVTPWGGFKRWYTPSRGQNTLTLNRWIVDQAATGAIGLALDAYPLLSCGEPELLCPALAAPYKDGLHFGKLGQQKLGDALRALAFPSCGNKATR